MENSEVNVAQASESDIQSLVELGFTREKAEAAIIKTGNVSVDMAALHLLNGDLTEEEELDDEWEDINENFKMVLVINSDLNMSLGKIAAQVCHGCLDVYQKIERGQHQDSIEGFHLWKDEGQKVVVLSGKNAEELKELYKKACDLNIASHLVQDAGRTEVAPGSITVLALFGNEQIVNKVTGTLRLMK